MITIKITGPRGEGSTTTTAAIVKMLRDAGQIVRYVGNNRHQEQEVERLLAGPVLDMLDPREFVVVDQLSVSSEAIICPGCGGIFMPFDVQKAKCACGWEASRFQQSHREAVEALCESYGLPAHLHGSPGRRGERPKFNAEAADIPTVVHGTPTIMRTER
jgi:hypothetical protein